MKTPALDLYLIKLQGWTGATLLKIDSNTGIFFLWVLQNFKKIFFYRTSLVAPSDLIWKFSLNNFFLHVLNHAFYI